MRVSALLAVLVFASACWNVTEDATLPDTVATASPVVASPPPVQPATTRAMPATTVAPATDVATTQAPVMSGTRCDNEAGDRIAIPAIDVCAPLLVTGAIEGVVTPPWDGATSLFDAGHRPGEVGVTLISGHVSSKRGPDVFYDLPAVPVGVDIYVWFNEVGYRYRVVSNESIPDKELPYERADAATSPILWVVTCGGVWDEAARHYKDNTLVSAIPA